MALPLKKEAGKYNLFNPASHNQVTHTVNSGVKFSNGSRPNYRVNYSNVPNSLESGTSLGKPGAYVVKPTKVININSSVNRRSVTTRNRRNNNDNNRPVQSNKRKRYNNFSNGLLNENRFSQMLNESSQSRGGSRKTRKSKRKSRARKTRKAF